MQEQRRAEAGRGDTVPTTEFVGALWRMSRHLLPIAKVDWAFKYYRRFRKSPDALDLQVIREAVEIDFSIFQNQSALNGSHVAAVRTALLELGKLNGRSLGMAVDYYERFRRNAGAPEDELAAEGIRWALAARTHHSYSGVLDYSQVTAIRTALLEYGPVTPMLLSRAVAYHKPPYTSVKECAKLAVRGYEIADRYWLPD